MLCDPVQLTSSLRAPLSAAYPLLDLSAETMLDTLSDTPATPMRLTPEADIETVLAFLKTVRSKTTEQQPRKKRPSPLAGDQLTQRSRHENRITADDELAVSACAHNYIPYEMDVELRDALDELRSIQPLATPVVEWHRATVKVWGKLTQRFNQIVIPPKATTQKLLEIAKKRLIDEVACLRQALRELQYQQLRIVKKLMVTPKRREQAERECQLLTEQLEKSNALLVEKDTALSQAISALAKLQKVHSTTSNKLELAEAQVKQQAEALEAAKREHQTVAASATHSIGRVKTHCEHLRTELEGMQHQLAAETEKRGHMASDITLLTQQVQEAREAERRSRVECEQKENTITELKNLLHSASNTLEQLEKSEIQQRLQLQEVTEQLEKRNIEAECLKALSLRSFSSSSVVASLKRSSCVCLYQHQANHREKINAVFSAIRFQILPSETRQCALERTATKRLSHILLPAGKKFQRRRTTMLALIKPNPQLHFSVGTQYDLHYRVERSIQATSETRADRENVSFSNITSMTHIFVSPDLVTPSLSRSPLLLHRALPPRPSHDVAAQSLSPRACCNPSLNNNALTLSTGAKLDSCYPSRRASQLQPETPTPLADYCVNPSSPRAKHTDSRWPFELFRTLKLHQPTKQTSIRSFETLCSTEEKHHSRTDTSTSYVRTQTGFSMSPRRSSILSLTKSAFDADVEMRHGSLAEELPDGDDFSPVLPGFQQPPSPRCTGMRSVSIAFSSPTNTAPITQKCPKLSQSPVVPLFSNCPHNKIQNSLAALKRSPAQLLFLLCPAKAQSQCANAPKVDVAIQCVDAALSQTTTKKERRASEASSAGAFIFCSPSGNEQHAKSTASSLQALAKEGQHSRRYSTIPRAVSLSVLTSTKKAVRYSLRTEDTRWGLLAPRKTPTHLLAHIPSRQTGYTTAVAVVAAEIFPNEKLQYVTLEQQEQSLDELRRFHAEEILMLQERHATHLCDVKDQHTAALLKTKEYYAKEILALKEHYTQLLQRAQDEWRPASFPLQNVNSLDNSEWRQHADGTFSIQKSRHVEEKTALTTEDSENIKKEYEAKLHEQCAILESAIEAREKTLKREWEEERDVWKQKSKAKEQEHEERLATFIQRKENDKRHWETYVAQLQHQCAATINNVKQQLQKANTANAELQARIEKLREAERTVKHQCVLLLENQNKIKRDAGTQTEQRLTPYHHKACQTAYTGALTSTPVNWNRTRSKGSETLKVSAAPFIRPRDSVFPLCAPATVLELEKQRSNTRTSTGRPNGISVIPNCIGTLPAQKLLDDLSTVRHQVAYVLRASDPSRSKTCASQRFGSALCRNDELPWGQVAHSGGQQKCALERMLDHV